MRRSRHVRHRRPRRTQLVQKIVGRDLATLYPESSPKARADVVLEVEGLTATGCRDVSFTAHRGEILGIAGLQGSGRSEIIRLLFGAQQRRTRHVHSTARTCTSASRRGDPAGIAHVPEDSIHHGVFGRMTIAENLSLPTVGRYWKDGRMRVGPRRARSRAHRRSYVIRPGNAAQMMGRLLRRQPTKGCSGQVDRNQPHHSPAR